MGGYARTLNFLTTLFVKLVMLTGLIQGGGGAEELRGSVACCVKFTCMGLSKHMYIIPI